MGLSTINLHKDGNINSLATTTYSLGQLQDIFREILNQSKLEQVHNVD